MDTRYYWLGGAVAAVGAVLLAARSASAEAQGPSPSGLGPGEGLGDVNPITLWNTYYYLAQESDYTGAKDTLISMPDGTAIAHVTARFASDLAIEGSGKLDDGRVVNYASGTRADSRYHVMDPNRYPWGVGVQGMALEPFRSLAVDPHTIAYGSKVYIQQFDGLAIPQIGSIGGFVHDGCFTAADTGGAIIGNHVDVFCGTRAMWHAMEGILPTRSQLTAYVNAPRCTG